MGPEGDFEAVEHVVGEQVGSVGLGPDDHRVAEAVGEGPGFARAEADRDPVLARRRVAAWADLHGVLQMG